jgi:phosphotransferase system enzyme I (PtsP)
VKAMMLDLDIRKAQDLLLPLLHKPSGTVGIRAALEAFAKDEGLQL